MGPSSRTKSIWKQGTRPTMRTKNLEVAAAAAAAAHSASRCDFVAVEWSEESQQFGWPQLPHAKSSPCPRMVWGADYRESRIFIQLREVPCVCGVSVQSPPAWHFPRDVFLGTPGAEHR